MTADEAAGRLTERELRAIARRAARSVPARHRGDVEPFAFEAAVRAAARAGVEYPKAYAATAARNAATDELRRIQRRERIEPSASGEDVQAVQVDGSTESCGAHDDGVDALLDRIDRERASLGPALLAILTPRQRQAVVLVVCEDHTYRSAAQVMGIDYSRVAQLVKRGRERMRAAIAAAAAQAGDSGACDIGAA